MKCAGILRVIGCVVLLVVGSSVVFGGHKYNGDYMGANLDRVAFPLGGIGAGMVCLEGRGGLSSWSLRNRPAIFVEHQLFSAICVKGGDGNVARVLEGPVSKWKVFAVQPGGSAFSGPGNGLSGKTYGLPRFHKASFSARFPFGTVALEDAKVPLKVEITGWSPFTPPDADGSSLPVVGLEYRFINHTDREVEAVYSFNSENFMKAGGQGAVKKIKNGFILAQPADSKVKRWQEGYFAAFVDGGGAKVNCAWFRGGWFDALTTAWKDIEQGRCYDKGPVTTGRPSPGATIFVPMRIEPGGQKTVRLMLCWYVPYSDVKAGSRVTRAGEQQGEQTYQPWYAGRFADIDEVIDYWRGNYERLRNETKRFSDCFYDTTLPAEAVEAVSANLSILKSPTVLRQKDGRMWGWEGCHDGSGCCPGSCTHVWNYAQAAPHLFASLERSLRETEFFVCENARGHQNFRCPLPIGEPSHGFYAAADGQLGCVMKVYRDWRIGGDTQWMKRLWPKVKASLDYCINQWDPEHKGVLVEPHHNTYDIEFWGAEPMCSSFYLGALKAAAAMGRVAGDDVSVYSQLFEEGRRYVDEELFNGEYFEQKVQWKGLRADPLKMKSFGGQYSAEAQALLQKEGPKYQYGTGCLSDGVLGQWLGEVSGVGEILEKRKVTSHLRSVYRYNLKRDLSGHSNPQRPGYALGDEGGLLICTWPKGGQPSLPFVYSNEVWTGIEYQAASHMIMEGLIEEGLEVVRTARDRYDGRVRNPFDEYECGHFYARAMSSYALLAALTGARYDAVEKVLYIRPAVKGDFRGFLCTATGYGTVGVKDGRAFCEVAGGKIPFERIEYSAR